MSVTPIQVEMTSTGGAGRSQVTVTNDSNEPLPVEVAIEKLSLEEDGDRKLTKAGDNFLVFPPQAMIAPGSSQVFRLQWVGEPMIAASESYLLSVNQVPVKMPAGKSAVQIVMSFGVIINVAPPQGSPEPRRRLDRGRGGQEVRQALSDDHGREPDQYPRAAAAVDDRALGRRLVAHHVGDGALREGRHRPRAARQEAPLRAAC